MMKTDKEYRCGLREDGFGTENSNERQTLFSATLRIEGRTSSPVIVSLETLSKQNNAAQ